jgi:membrane associated rhomboid family serine protease
MVIPLGDDNPTRRRPIVTWLLLAGNVGVFLFVQPLGADACTEVAFYLEHATVPAEIVQGEPLSAEQLAGTPADRCDLEPRSDKPVYAAVLYSMFLHAGWLHLLGNMLYLGIFGNNIEDRFGHLPFLGFYLASGAGATAVFVAANPDSTATLVGASGAIAGVLGSYFLLFPGAWVTVWVPVLIFLVIRLPAFLVLGLWFVLQLQPLGEPAMAGGGGVAYLAHAAGFVIGAALTVVSGVRRRTRADIRRTRERRRRRRT